MSAYSPTRVLRAAVIGAGYLGKFHIQKYASFPDIHLVAVVDTHKQRAEEVARQYGVPAFSDYRAIIKHIDLASIVVPTELHFEVARDCLNAGAHILVEKPVTQTLDEAQHLIDLAHTCNRIFQVGHLERFNPAIMALEDTLGNPTFIEAHRLAPFKTRGIDVNVVLDLMIHDIDIVLNMVNSKIVDVRAAGSSVLTREVDIANARLEFENGCIANITASRVSKAPMRKIRVFQPDSYFSIDYSERKISIHRKQGTGADPDGFPIISTEEKHFEAVDALQHEIRAFIDAVKSGGKPVVSGEDGKRALEVALEITNKLQHVGVTG